MRFVALAACLTFAGCITVDPDPEIPPDTPITLRPDATALQGLEMDKLVVEAEKTIENFPLESRGIHLLAEKARTSVVSIYVDTGVPARVRLLPIQIPGLGIPVSLPGKGLGSGFFIHPGGYVLTNHHVIRNVEKLSMITSDGQKLGAAVVAFDPVYDLALLKALDPRRDFPALPMGDSTKVGPGDLAMAIGNPLGLGHSVTMGIISQTGRNLTGVSEEEGRSIRYIQMDTSINPGSSGGPLITLSGAWIGVNTAGAVAAQGINFAVPSLQVREFLDEVLRGEGTIQGVLD